MAVFSVLAFNNVGRARKLRLFLALLFLVIAIPVLLLAVRAYDQLKWEGLHQYRLAAESLAASIDRRWLELIDREERRSFAEYQFWIVASGLSNTTRKADKTQFLQRSPLAAYPVQSSVPGLIGYFEVDNAGRFSSPLLPKDDQPLKPFELAPDERNDRLVLKQQLRQILTKNRLVEEKPSAIKPALSLTPSDSYGRYSSESQERAISRQPEPASVAKAPKGFDRLTQKNSDQKSAVTQQQQAPLAQLKKRPRDDEAQTATSKALSPKPAPSPSRVKRREQTAIAEAFDSQADLAVRESEPALQVKTFTGEIDPFEMSLLDSEHFVLFRKVWRDGARFIQGAIVDQKVFIRAMIARDFQRSSIFNVGNAVVAYQGNTISSIDGSKTGTSAETIGILYSTRLSAPADNIELLFTLSELPVGLEGQLVIATTVILLVLLVGGLSLIYWAGVRQIALSQQQQNFVSAVSHELKTPLTSIRMYGEILREGWASEAKQREYYDYIFFESERLSRLISNVLQLAKMSRDDHHTDLKPVSVQALLDVINSKMLSHIERAGFSLEIDIKDDCADTTITVDVDHFTQIMINLIDNALKFSAKAERKVVAITAYREKSSIVITLRDFGPGIEPKKLKAIFELFYRCGNELTRETAGTGIGLALVKELSESMGATITAENCSPGARFLFSIPLKT